MGRRTIRPERVVTVVGTAAGADDYSTGVGDGEGHGAACERGGCIIGDGSSMATGDSICVASGRLCEAGSNAVRLFGSSISGSDDLSVITVSLCGVANWICVWFRLIWFLLVLIKWDRGPAGPMISPGIHALDDDDLVGFA